MLILSTTLLQNDGTYKFENLNQVPDVMGMLHYVGHPATRYILDKMGAIYTPGYFKGLATGESFFVAQLKDPRKGQAFTTDQPNVSMDDLKWSKVTRLS